MTGDRPTTPGWHCHRCRSTSCRQRADSDTDHVGRVEYRPLLLTQPSSVSWLWSHTHWCPSQRPQEVMRVDGSANPTMPKNPAQYPVYIHHGSRRAPVPRQLKGTKPTHRADTQSQQPRQRVCRTEDARKARCTQMFLPCSFGNPFTPIPTRPATSHRSTPCRVRRSCTPLKWTCTQSWCWCTCRWAGLGSLRELRCCSPPR